MSHPHSHKIVAWPRTLLVLGRVSNLPTVWSNCLAGWTLNGGSTWPDFLWLCIGASLLYSGGMFLNDACDVEFDRKYRSERPIPSGRISLRKVGWLSVIFLTTGWGVLWPLGLNAVLAGLSLIVAIVTYNLVHKRTAFAPWLMASCRWLLYVVAAASTRHHINDAVVWHGFALGAYVAGLSLVARAESAPSAVGRWPWGLLFVPIVLGLVWSGSRDAVSWLAMASLAGWIGWCMCGGRLWGAIRVRFATRISRGRDVQVPRVNQPPMVAGLLAGIILVDWVAVAPVSARFDLVLIPLFVIALILQRKVPAT